MKRKISWEKYVESGSFYFDFGFISHDGKDFLKYPIFFFS